MITNSRNKQLPAAVGELLHLHIDNLNHNGDGVGRYFGYTIFVPGALPGEDVYAKVAYVRDNYAQAILESIETTSPHRVTPVCNQAATCGGCQLQHQSYDAQLKCKQQTVINALTRIGGFSEPIPIKPIIGMDNPLCYRNKAQVPLGARNDNVVAGFYGKRSHDIVPLERCHLQPPACDRAIHAARRILEDMGISIYSEQSHTGFARHLLTRYSFATGNILLAIITNGRTFPGGGGGEGGSDGSGGGTTDGGSDSSGGGTTVGGSVSGGSSTAGGGSIGGDGSCRSGINGGGSIGGDGSSRSGINGGGSGVGSGEDCSSGVAAAVDFASALRRAVPEISGIVQIVNTRKGNTILGTDEITLWGTPWLYEYLGGLEYKISARSFFQINPTQTDVLYKTAVDFAALTGAETVLDLYCGSGGASLYLARRAGRVIGVESVESAVRDARENASRNGITNVVFHAGLVEKIVPKLYEEGIKANVVIVDPPRKGCDAALLETLARMHPKKLIYISCNPATLARDLRILTRNNNTNDAPEAPGNTQEYPNKNSRSNYKIKFIQPVDMFPQTSHVEVATLLTLE